MNATSNNSGGKREHPRVVIIYNGAALALTSFELNVLREAIAEMQRQLSAAPIPPASDVEARSGLFTRRAVARGLRAFVNTGAPPDSPQPIAAYRAAVLAEEAPRIIAAVSGAKRSTAPARSTGRTSAGAGDAPPPDEWQAEIDRRLGGAGGGNELDAGGVGGA